SHTITGALHASFQHMGHAKSFGDLAQVAFRPAPILHDRSTADDLKVRHLGKDGQNFILDAVGEVSVLFLVTEILKRQDRYTLSGNRRKSSARVAGFGRRMMQLRYENRICAQNRDSNRGGD